MHVFPRWALSTKCHYLLTLDITDSIHEAGFLGFGGTNHRSMEMERFWSRPSCLVNWALRASKVMPPELVLELKMKNIKLCVYILNSHYLKNRYLITVASWNKARVNSSTSPSSNFIPFSSMQARITCCSSFSWMRPSPEIEFLGLFEVLKGVFGKKIISYSYAEVNWDAFRGGLYNKKID